MVSRRGRSSKGDVVKLVGGSGRGGFEEKKNKKIVGELGGQYGWVN